jgi:isopropylmalate/homocitrate/citramalate synthase
VTGEFWTGGLNEGFALDAEVGFYDTTLRDGEQTVGVVLSPEEKLELARGLDELGIERIEAGFPRVSEDDYRAVQLIAQAGLGAEIWGFSRAVASDVQALVDLGVKASVIESPISDLKLDALGVSRAQMLQRITDAIANATEHGIRVAFFGVDSTRAQPDYFAEAYRAAVDAGAKEVVVVDTIGIATPEASEFLVRQTREWVGPDVPVHWHGHNDFGVATACSLAAVKGGARWIQGTINGMGERAGNANLAEIALALRGLYGVRTNLRLEHVRAFAERLRALSGYELEPFKPLFGENLFTRESGAVAAQFHEPEAIEPYASDVVGARRRIVLGKKSGIDSIRIKAKELGLELTDDEQRRLLAEVKKRGTEKRGLVSDEEFRDLARG